MNTRSRSTRQNPGGPGARFRARFQERRLRRARAKPYAAQDLARARLHATEPTADAYKSDPKSYGDQEKFGVSVVIGQRTSKCFELLQLTPPMKPNIASISRRLAFLAKKARPAPSAVTDQVNRPARSTCVTGGAQQTSQPSIGRLPLSARRRYTLRCSPVHMDHLHHYSGQHFRYDLRPTLSPSRLAQSNAKPGREHLVIAASATNLTTDSSHRRLAANRTTS